jgi:hypothetical protein
MGGEDIILTAWTSIADCFSETKLAPTSIAELRYIEQLKGLCLNLWGRISN